MFAEEDTLIKTKVFSQNNVSFHAGLMFQLSQQSLSSCLLGESKVFFPLSVHTEGKYVQDDRKWPSSIERKGNALESCSRYIRYHIQAIRAAKGRQRQHLRCARIHGATTLLFFKCPLMVNYVFLQFLNLPNCSMFQFSEVICHVYLMQSFQLTTRIECLH